MTLIQTEGKRSRLAKKKKKSLLIDAAVCFASVVAVLSYFIFPNVSIAKYYCITFRIVANHQVEIHVPNDTKYQGPILNKN